VYEESEKGIFQNENIPESQRQLLRSWRIRVQQIGHELGRPGMKDEEIIPLLHQLRMPSFFTHDFVVSRNYFVKKLHLNLW
jgi:hypothetical protein